jgi:hypothetical protein
MNNEESKLVLCNTKQHCQFPRMGVVASGLLEALGMWKPNDSWFGIGLRTAVSFLRERPLFFL